MTHHDHHHKNGNKKRLLMDEPKGNKVSLREGRDLKLMDLN